MKTVKIKSIKSEQYSGNVYNLELETLEKADDLYWIDGNSGLVSHNCFPKDIRALIKTGKDYEYEMDILKTVNEVNEYQKLVLMSKLYDEFYHEMNNDKSLNIGIWGLSFKPNTDDMREAPSIEIIKKLLDFKFSIKVYDPVAMKNAKTVFGDKIEYCETKYDVIENVDCLMVLTEWSEFRTFDFEILSKKMNKKIIFDGRNIYDKEELESYGFKCIGIGR